MPATVQSLPTGTDPGPAEQHEWHGWFLGLPVDLLVTGPESAIRRAQFRLRQLEARWRLDGPESEIRRLNQWPGTLMEVSADTLLLADLAVHRWPRRPGQRPPLVVDVRHGKVGLAGQDPLDLVSLAGVLAVDLLIEELAAADATDACVRIGPNQRQTELGPHIQHNWGYPSCP